MSEFLRIYKDKKRIIFLIGLLVLNLIFVLKDNLGDMDMSTAYAETVLKYREMEIDEAYQQNQNAIEAYYSKDDVFHASLCQQLSENIVYIKDYEDKYERMVDNAGRMISFGLVGGKDTYAYKNIRKTLLDFADIENLEVELVNDRSVKAFMKFDMTDYMIILAILIIAASFAEEQKKGLFYIVRSCVGRNRLVFTRQILLLLSSFVICVLFYGTTYIFMGIIHGFVSPNVLVQCFPVFGDCCQVMTIGTFMLIVILLKTVVAYMIGNLFWLVINIFNNMPASLGMVSVLFIFEYMAYNNVTEGNAYVLLKYFNLFNFINIERVYTHYFNIDLFGKCVGVVEFSVLTLLVTTAIITLIATIVAVKKRFMQAGHVKVWNTVCKYIGALKTERHTCLTLHEGYRYLKCNTALMIMVVFGVFVVVTYENARPEYDGVQSYINEHYSNMEGKLDETTNRYLELQREQIMKEWSELGAYILENPEYKDNPGYRDMLLELQTREAALEFMEQENVRLMELNRAGYDVCFVNFVGYKSIFEVSSISTYVSYLIPILFVVILASAVFSYDNEYNFVKFLKSTPKGRKDIVRIRIIYVFICTVIVWAVINGIEIYKVASTYGIHQMRADVSSLNIFMDVKFHISIGMVLTLFYIMRLVVLLCIVMITLCISTFLPNSKQSYVVSLVVLILPAAFVTIGVNLFSWISFIDVYKTHGNIKEILMGNYTATLPFLICGAAGVVSYMELRKKMY